MELKNYEIAEYEEKLKNVLELKQRIDNPEPNRLLSEHRKLEKEFKESNDFKLRCYAEIKRIIESGCRLLKIKSKSGKYLIGYFKREWSDAGHPKIYYGVWPGCAIITSRNVDKEEISPKEFMEELLKDPIQNFYGL